MMLRFSSPYVMPLLAVRRYLNMIAKLALTVSVVAMFISSWTAAQSRPMPDRDGTAVNWLTGEDVSLGGVLSPHVHFDTIFGTSSTDPATLAVGHHDPDRKGFTLSNTEFGASVRATDFFEGFTSYAAKVDLDDQWQGEFEEWFGKLKNLPGGIELRGGRFYNRFGIQNTYHPHGFDWADQYLVSGRFLGEDTLTTIGGEANWTLPIPWTSILTASVGVPPEREDEAHAEPAVEPEFEAEGAAFDDVIVAANWTSLYDYNDFHQFRGGLSGAWGENIWGKLTQIYGAHFEYQWRENGYEPGGDYFRWRTEAMIRAFDAVSGHLPGERESEGGEDENADRRAESFDEFGAYTSALFGLDCGLEFGLRGEFVSGIRTAGLDERFRVSPGITYFANRARTLKLRIQYNYDHSNDFGDEHSIWAQLGLAWGGKEVR